jgi:hypothetical protein
VYKQGRVRVKPKACHVQGRIQDFKLVGVLKKIAASGGRRENFGVFRAKNHDFTPKNPIFSNFRGGRAAISCEKSRFYAKKSNFFQF